MQKVDVKIVKWIEEGFTLYKNNFATLVLASVIALVLSTVTIGILAGPDDRRPDNCHPAAFTKRSAQTGCRWGFQGL